MENFTIRPALPGDAGAIRELIDANHGEGRLMRLPLRRIEARIHEFAVAESGGAVVGCGALHFHTQGIWEACSLSIKAGLQRKGIGTALVTELLGRAGRGETVYAATLDPTFAAGLGFEIIPTLEVPKIIWLHKITTMLEQSLADWPRIASGKYFHLRLSKPPETPGEGRRA